LKEDIFLWDHLDGRVAELFRALVQVGEVASTGFDFYVCWHVVNSNPSIL
jgi:hypothetical protein